MAKMTEDEVREYAGTILDFQNDSDATSGVGQLTTFKQLGFTGKLNNKKPDGWYLPKLSTQPAIILETKKESGDFSKADFNQIAEYIKKTETKYEKVIGILYKHDEIHVYKGTDEYFDTPQNLQSKEYYLGLFNQNKIDKQVIYDLTKKINNCLHFKFGIQNLYHRMVFTACTLVSLRYGAKLHSGVDYTTFHTSIHSTLAKSLIKDKQQNIKLEILLEVYAEIKMNTQEDQKAIDEFIEWVKEISDHVNSDFWRGEDVMGIFFNEFNRYKGKSESGQVFTPEHITSFMYRLLEVDKTDKVLDAACGSGGFLVKAMANMLKESGGINSDEADEIMKNKLYGIEFDRQLYALACANMLIHKDGKTNLEQLDTRTDEACDWIESKEITKVLMNPPFENKYGCIPIVKNVLDSVSADITYESKLNKRTGKYKTIKKLDYIKKVKCAFILPDKKLEKVASGKKLLKNHRLEKIIKLPEKLFLGEKTSIFIFTAGVPQNNKEIFTCYIEDDGLETVKNQGRQDIRDRWATLEDEWIKIIEKKSGHSTIKWIDPEQHLSYQIPEQPFTLSEENFNESIMDYLMYEQKIDKKAFAEKIANRILYQNN